MTFDNPCSPLYFIQLDKLSDLEDLMGSDIDKDDDNNDDDDDDIHNESNNDNSRDVSNDNNNGNSNCIVVVVIVIKHANMIICAVGVVVIKLAFLSARRGDGGSSGSLA